MSAVLGRKSRPREQQAAQAPVPSGGPGHWRLQHDRRRRQGDGLPVRRQGLLRPAGHPDDLAPNGRRSTSTSSPSTWTRSSPNFPADVLPAYLTELGVAFHIENQDTYSIVKRLIPEGKTTCSLCSRLRRGILYRVADELGATKIALGHHRDDILETFFLNMFFGGKLKGMPAKLVSRRRQARGDPSAGLRQGSRYRALWRRSRTSPSSRATCAARRRTCSASRSRPCCANGEKKTPGRVENIYSSLSTVVPSHLMDRELFGFKGHQGRRRRQPTGRHRLRRRALCDAGHHPRRPSRCKRSKARCSAIEPGPHALVFVVELLHPGAGLHQAVVGVGEAPHRHVMASRLQLAGHALGGQDRHIYILHAR